MSDFTERARAEAEREYPLSESPVMDKADVLATYRQAAFMWGAEWARRELLADPTEDEIEDAASRPCRDVDTVDVHTIIAAFLESRRGSE